MKKDILGLLCVISFLACNDNTEEIFQVQSSQLIGEWVCNQEDDKAWKKMSFGESDAFKYSDENMEGRNIFEEQGMYRIISNNILECMYYNNNFSYFRNLIVSEITDNYLKVEEFEGESMGISAYVRILESYEMKSDERIIPNYSQLVKGNIIGFKSHEPTIAVVDSVSGEITAVFPGRTYIDVETDESVAVIEIIVSDLWPDYTQYIGKSKDDVKDCLGTPNFELSMSMLYKIEDNEYINSLTFYLSSITNKVDRFVINLKEDYDIQKIVGFLNNKYYYYENWSVLESKQYAFINKHTYNESSIIITLSGLNNNIVYLEIK